MRGQILMMLGALVLWSGCTDDGGDAASAERNGAHDMMSTASDLGAPVDDATPPTSMDDATSPAPGSDGGLMRPAPTFGLSTQSIDVDGVQREYLIYVPESYDGTIEVPVMMNFHGGSMNAQAQMFLADMRPLAETENFILIYPEGTLLDSGDPHWNPLVSSENNKSDADDFGF